MHFRKAIDSAGKTGAESTLGNAYLDLGMLHKARRRMDKAREYISTAIQHFEHCGAETHLRQAKEILASLA